MYPLPFPAGFCQWGNSAEGLNLVRTPIAFPLRAKCCQQARSHHRARPRQRIKDEKIRMRCYFRLEDQVPENHLLRLIDKHISFEFVRERLRTSYSESGRPSIDPELLLRILLIGYLYGISSERKLVEELRMHLAWRWFTGLGFDQEMPHHSTFSKNRHGRFQSRNCWSNSSNRSCASVWKWDWCRASTYRWMAASSRPMRPKKVAFHAN